MSAQSVWPSINLLKRRIGELRDIFKELPKTLDNSDKIPVYREGPLRRLQGNLNGTKAQMRQTFNNTDPAKVDEPTDYDRVESYKEHLHEKIDKLKLFVDALCGYFGDDETTEYETVLDAGNQYHYQAEQHPFSTSLHLHRRTEVLIDERYTFCGGLWKELDNLDIVVCATAEKVRAVADQFPDWYWEKLDTAHAARDEVCWDHA